MIGKIFASEIWGGGGLIYERAYILGGAYYRNFTVVYLQSVGRR